MRPYRGVQPLAHRHEKGQGKGRIDGPAHALYAEEHEPQHHQHQVDDPHKAAHIDLGEQVGQQDGQAGCAAKGKMVGVLEIDDAHGGEDQTEVEIMETVDYGDTDYRYEMEGDRKYDDDYDKSSLGEMGYQSQEFDDNGELVNSEDDDYVDDDYTDDSFDGSDDEF